MAESEMGGAGGLASLIGGKSSDDDLKQIFLNEGFQNAIRAYNKLYRPENLGYQDAANQYSDLYAANTPAAKENAAYYANIAKGIFSNTDTPKTNLTDYLGASYDFINKGRTDLANSVRQNLNLDNLAAGRGGMGPSSYSEANLASRLGGVFAPLYNTALAGSGNYANNAFAQQKAWDQYRLGQFAQDPLTGYLDTATAGRAINPYMTRVGLLNQGVSGLGGLLPLYQGNSAGFKVVKGLTSRLNDTSTGFMNLANFSTQLGGSIAGMGGGMGGQASAPSGSGAGLAGEAMHTSQMANMQLAPAAQSYYPQSMPSVPQSGGYYQPMMQWQQPPAQYNPYNPNSPALGGYFPT